MAQITLAKLFYLGVAILGRQLGRCQQDPNHRRYGP
jgi:hypothetical protein